MLRLTEGKHSGLRNDYFFQRFRCFILHPVVTREARPVNQFCQCSAIAPAASSNVTKSSRLEPAASFVFTDVG